MKTLHLKHLTFLLLFSIALFTSCSDDNSNGSDEGQLTINAKATFNGNANRMIQGRNANAEIALTKFKMNIKEIELEFDDDYYDDDNGSDDDGGDDDGGNDYDDDGYYGYDDEIELSGPFELDLLSGSFSFVTIDVPNAVFEEIEFDFDRNNNSQSDLFGKTVLMEGTIDGVPFVFWHDFEEDFELDFDDNNNDIVINNNASEITITFNLDFILGASTGVDLSNAQDGNGDGIITISPNDTDGNQSLANQLKEKIKDYADLLDD